jgi:streptogramin lyase
MSRIFSYLVVAILVAGLGSAQAAEFRGRVSAPDGSPVVGARVSFAHGDPLHEVTVYSAADGSFRTPELKGRGPWSLRVRRIGWRDLEEKQVENGPLDLVLKRETDPASVAGQLPANRWYGLVLAKLDDPAQREELVRQCTFCHQQGNWSTRMLRPAEQWDKVLSLMGRMGAGLSPELREQIPTLFNETYDPETAVPILTANMHEPDFAPPPSAEARRAVIEEWQVGHRASMQHDIVVHPDGRIYSVDMTQDMLYRLDPHVPGGAIDTWPLPETDLPLGGVFGGRNTPALPNANARLGPHSIQVAPDGSLYMTLALGNKLGRFDPTTEAWTLIDVAEGFYPHTLRFDRRGRIWYTLAASNHLGMLDPETGEQRHVRLPARNWKQGLALRMLPFFLWLNRNFDLGEVSAGEGMTAPVPYGVDIAPDGGVWLSQLNEHRIGRIDPDTLELEMIDTPFTGPRRLRFDSQGRLWIPGFSAGLVSRFDPATREFRSWQIPIEPLGSETPYALHVNHETDDVWICGTNSDTLIRFRPATQAFTIYPLPTRVTYTREIDFDAQGRVWTSNSNVPTWQIENGFPRLIRLDPNAGSVGGE